MSADVIDGVAIDSWGQEWLLGGSIASAPHVRWSAEPDVPVGVGELGSMPPGPQLAAWLAALDPAEVSDLDLVDLVGAHRRLISWAEAGQVAAIAELSRRPVFRPDDPRDEHDELRSAGCQVAVELNLAPSTGARLVETARTLVEELPHTLAAMGSGEVDLRRARMIADIADRHSAEVARKVEGRVLPRAGRRTLGEHRRAIERAILVADPQTAEERHRAAAEGRRVEFWPDFDGMGCALATLPADGLAVLRTTLDAAAVAMKTALPGESRTMDQLRSDALVEMARVSLATGWLGGRPDGGLKLASAQGRRAQIHVTVPFSTLIGVDEHPGELTGYGPIPASIARRIAVDGVWRRLLTNPATGKLLDYGRTTYQPPQDLRDFIVARDRTCVFLGCSQPAHRCQIDHTIPYPEGPTAEDNLGALYGTCHNQKTHAKWQLGQHDSGRFVWTSPVGRTYEREPAAIGPIIDMDTESRPRAQADRADDPDPPPF